MNRAINSPTPAPQDFIGVAPINKGGTGSSDTFSAITALGGIAKSKLGQPGYVAKLSAGGTLDPSALPSSVVNAVTLKGPKSLYLSQTATYTISNYDGKSTYPASVSAGTVSVAGNVVTVNAPATAQTINLTVAGRVIPIVVTAARPVAPTIAVTTAAAGSNITATLTGSAFAMQSGSLTQLSADWEIYTDVTLTKLLATSLDDKVNLTSWVGNGLLVSTNYYARVRYSDVNGNKSDWSVVVAFVTKASYVIGAEEAKLLASDPAASDRFGYSVAMTSDGSRVVIGAYYKTGIASNQGAGYVFARNGTTWTQEAKLLASDPAGNDSFGSSVSITTDGSRVVVGASGKIGTYTGQGTAYIFLRNGATWSQEAKLLASDPTGNDNFGTFVSIVADGSRVVIGAFGRAAKGAAYVFTRSGVIWVQEAKLLSGDLSINDNFGFSVSMSSDGSRVAIGAYGKAGSAGTNQGAAYVFTRSGSSWSQEAKLLATDPATSDFFGYSVSITSDGSRIVIGATYKTGGSSGQGAVYIFLRTGTSWIQEAKLLAGDPGNGDYFGNSVSITADGSRAAIGAYVKTGAAGAAQGAAYVFLRTGTTWTQESKLLASDPSGGSDYFGGSVSITADGSRVAIGAYYKTGTAGTSQGAVYIEA